jgi:bifunctional UDP-N-acetylglucosamine pyrophosphorylase/glucosamine-1-phosphate N-acetyltransferase
MSLSVVILSAGLGKRMKSGIPKVLHEVLGKPMLQYVIDAVKPLKPQRTVVVIGNGADEVRRRISDSSIRFVVQKNLLGTGNALSVARKELNSRTTLVLNGDGPLLTTKTLKALFKKHRQSRNILSFLTFINDSMSGYGRISRDDAGKITGIIEDKHATTKERNTYKELNGGIYMIEKEGLSFLNRIKKNRDSGEYYITDIVSLASRTGGKVEAYSCPSEEIHGVNTRHDLHKVSDILRKRYISQWMDKGVTYIDPDTSIVHPEVSIGRDTVIYPNTCIEGNSSIGKNCIIYPGTRVFNSSIGNEVIIKDNTVIEESKIGDKTVIGPFAHLRPHSVIGRKAKIGNFVEIKKSDIGDNSKASHLSYLGDAEIGNNVNIGAGTITCNYDGKTKFKTKIEAGVFVGSDSQLIAPVKIGKGAYIAAGATISDNVPPGALAITRVKQLNLEDWVKTRQLKSENKNTKSKKGGKGKS